jgi:hypothetical protein
MTEIGFVTWKLVQLVLWAGPFGVAAFLAAIAAGSFAAGYFVGRRKPKEIAMGHQMPLHGKTEFLPDGTNTPVDIFN